MRARTHLTQIVPALREAALRFTAVELELLLARPLIGDLLALTRALEHRADRVAWLAVLRAPWCGLTLSDLSALVEGAVGTTIWQLVCDPSRRSQLSTDGQQRLARVARVLARALELYGRSPVAERVRETWWLLGGPACVSNDADRADAQSFFSHLAQHEERSRGVTDVAAFEASLVRLYAAADVQCEPRVAGDDDSQGQRTRVRLRDRSRVGSRAAQRRCAADAVARAAGRVEPRLELLLSPIYPPDVDKKDDSIYCWIERLQLKRQVHEDERLLYVAATRARKQLHWLACLPSVDGDLSLPRENSLLQRLWPAVEDECTARIFCARDRCQRASPPAVQRRALRPVATETACRLDFSGHATRGRPGTPTAAQSPKRRSSSRGLAKPRAESEWWCTAGCSASAKTALRGWNAARVYALAPRIERELAAAGIGGGELSVARSRVAQALTTHCPTHRRSGCWEPHQDARSELRLTVRTEAGAKRLVLDRTFVDDQGVRWIIDYKTGTHEGADVEGFLDRERLRYSGQLELYAQALGGAAATRTLLPAAERLARLEKPNGRGMRRSSKRVHSPFLHLQ